MLGDARRKIVGLLGVALLATVMPTSVSEAAEGTTEGNTAWLTDAFGHPVENYVGAPGELRGGVPASWVMLEGPAPNWCQGQAAVYSLGFLDEYFRDGTAGKYENHTRVWVSNPEGRHPTKQEVATVPGGPKATAECTSPHSGVAEATVAPHVNEEAVRFESASSKSTNAKTPNEDLIVTETTNRLLGVQVGEVSIASILSWLKVEFRPSVEPKISYRIELTGISDGSNTSGAGYEGVVLAGQALAGKDVTKQFNEQAEANQGVLEALGKYGLRVLEPRIGYSKSGRFVYEISALDVGFNPAARENELGHSVGYRVGVSRAAGRYEFNGQPTPSDGYGYQPDPALGVS